ncbi:putative bifunctional diguanylate cyclase/phosphodiesterase [Aerosakkonema funiforme]|uniref:putative bifunctional diguanylate cyclase/phosphodiesterase n=1 Tax=Aerosakkonema funiforme TaxID=1246630 RepID=UPI0035B8BB9D
MKSKPENSIDYRQQICDFLSNVNTKAQAKLLTLKHLKNKLENPVQEGTDELRIAFQELQNKIAELKRAEEELKESLSLQRAALESTVDGILVVNKNRKIATYNQKFVQMWRIPADIIALKDDKEALSFVVYQLKNPESFLAKVGEMYAQPEAESCDVLEFKDGRIFERYSQPQRLGKEIVGRVWSFRDITERRMAEETIRYQALHDLLTDLPNRILFNERLSGALVNAKSNQGTIAVMFLDLDRFKTINDTLSHACGDQLLQMVAERLTSSLWQHDTVARWGGDEFTLLLPQISCAEDAARIAQVILDTLKQPFNIEGHQLHISSSIGISLYPHDGEDGETLLRNADAALHRAKEQGRNNYQFYTAAMNSHASELLMLENELHQALERGEFVVYYQPQINTNTGKIAQMEALLRWQHPEFGLVSPAKFIPLAEENGLIIPIGEWVLRTACTQIKAWQDAGLPPLCVAVNLSARQFQQPNLVEMVARALQETGLENHFLELEITESVAMQNVDFSRSILQELHNMGVSISMDDFGTGYSSLSYLKKFPLDKLKIDQSFVRELATDPNDGAIIAAIAALGKVLNLTMVAEGVETEEQRDFLRSLECEYMQGYLFSKPLSPQDATELLENYRSSPNPVITITPSSYCSLCFNKRFNKGFVQ